MVKVSVWITTYNHEKFIAKAIESVLLQKTDFDYEIVIGEDCSTDNTRHIVQEFKVNYPEKILVYFPKKNIGMIQMSKATYELCSGEFIAWLDGDDYWTDPFKLQKQVQFLGSNHQYVMCFHNVKILNQLNHTFYDHICPLTDKHTLSVEDFITNNNPIFTPSVMHRNILGHHLPEWIYTLPFLDLGFYFLLLEHGKVGYSQEIMGVYRRHHGGAWSGKSQYQKLVLFIDFFQTLITNLDYLRKNKKLRKKVRKLIGTLNFDLLKLNLQNGNFKEWGNNILSILNYNFIEFFHRRKKLLKFLPWVSSSALKSDSTGKNPK